ncbi:hypothetical protein AWM68_20090 [Fictibacillus phosphorivorans]|uniref:Uncharacterized protein n=1 Tax=Fictibacillus phosphorivorans TaxID=1221500 RepID=A0A165NN92_9BACL|nr:hypothetical protein [Fictibacillus phosphorivorans]KZE66873.1 hypothetical protein AWM68_20090 [Fictibacillus phosphorivorans]
MALHIIHAGLKGHRTSLIPTGSGYAPIQFASFSSSAFAVFRKNRFDITASGIEPLPLGGGSSFGLLFAARGAVLFSFLRSLQCNNFAYDSRKGGRSGKEIGKAKSAKPP